ncbi:MAG TPA: hypothetical protein VH253_05325 [Phycisphaerae bacterium]|nr:hypothetical protein [Phycisphaerae bacterium]
MRRPAKAFAQRGLFVVLATAVLCWPLVYNRFPIVFGDSLLYSLTAFTGLSMAFRPSCYPYLLAAAGVFKSVTPLCIFQSLLAGVVLEIALRRAAGLRWAGAVGVLFGLGLLTTVAWWTSSLMPDIFFGLAVLSAGLLGFAGNLTRTDRVLLWGILVISVEEHVALPPPLLLLAGLWVLLQLVRRRRPTGASLGILGVAALGFVSYPALNALTGHAFAPSDSSSKYILSRMAGDGLLDETDMLHFTANAPERRADLLGRFHSLSTLPANVPLGYLSPQSARTGAYSHDAQSPFVEWTSDPRLPSFGQMIVRNLKRRPLQNVRAVIAGTVRLMGSGGFPLFVEQMHPSPPMPILAHDAHGFEESRQNHAALHVAGWNVLITPTYWIFSIAAAGALLSSIRYREAWKRVGTPLGAFILSFDVLHAATVYALSGDFPRYQSRVSWVVVLGGFLAVLSVVRTARAKEGGTRAGDHSPWRAV